MIEAVLIGMTIGVGLIILKDEMQWNVCQPCYMFWFTVVYCAVTFELILFGLVYLSANLCYLALRKSIYGSSPF